MIYEFTCANCGATTDEICEHHVPVGEHAPDDIRCESCGGRLVRERIELPHDCSRTWANRCRNIMYLEEERAFGFKPNSFDPRSKSDIANSPPRKTRKEQIKDLVKVIGG